MLDVFREVRRRQALGETVALATVIEVKGSTPRQPGAKMAIAADGSIFGTVGGGVAEHEVMRQAREVISSRRPRMVHAELTNVGAASLGAVCGGTMEIFVEPLGPADRT